MEMKRVREGEQSRINIRLGWTRQVEHAANVPLGLNVFRLIGTVRHRHSL
jgi:hypothetical protein